MSTLQQFWGFLLYVISWIMELKMAAIRLGEITRNQELFWSIH